MKYIYCLVLILLTSCGANKRQVELAKVSSEKYYDYIKIRSFDSVVQLFEKGFFDINIKDTVLNALRSMLNDYGEITAYALTRIENSNNFENGKAEDVLKLTYQTKYSKGAVTRETFTFKIINGYSGKIDGFKTVEWEDAPAHSN